MCACVLNPSAVCLQSTFLLSTNERVSIYDTVTTSYKPTFLLPAWAWRLPDTCKAHMEESEITAPILLLPSGQTELCSVIVGRNVLHLCSEHVIRATDL